ncbi:cytochrome P450 1A5 [Anolis carolinensis]|uniref:cytochrome P450 1A5 n=1 Tax=Anolis carolinensis TaxID=28377 RepID=UPI002F2B3413
MLTLEMPFMEVLSHITATEALLGVAVFCLFFMYVKSFQNRIPKGLKKIPGPTGFPLIGNALQMGKYPHLSLTRMSQKYGDVMMIHIGNTPVLVLSGLKTIHQALVRQATEFMGRPDLYSFRCIANGESLGFGRDSGEVWRARRKMVQNALKAFATSPSSNSFSTYLVEEHVSKEANYLIEKFQEVMLEKQSFDPYEHILVSTANIICAMCFSKSYHHDDEELLGIVNTSEKFVEVATSGNLADFIPLLRYLPMNSMKMFHEFNRKFYTFMLKEIKEHYESFSKDSIRDITDSLIDQSQKMFSISSENLFSFLNDLFGAAFDTVTTVMSWGLMYLVVHPEIQKKIQEEIDEVIGRARKPRLSDRPLMPYTEAFILEVFRHSSLLPFTIPHCTTKETVLNGYYIPKDICVFINQWQVNHDENLWKDPSSFNPERFLSTDGKDVNKDESEKVLIFGLGKRRCIGEPIARWEIFLFLTFLLQELEFSVKEGVKVDMTPRYGLSMKVKRCPHFQVKQRSLKNK